MQLDDINEVATVYILFEIALILTLSTTPVEGGFSTMKLIHTAGLNGLEIRIVSHIMYINANAPPMDAFMNGNKLMSNINLTWQYKLSDSEKYGSVKLKVEDAIGIKRVIASTTVKVTFADITNPKKKKVNVSAELLSDKLKKQIISHPKSVETIQTLACKYHY